MTTSLVRRPTATTLLARLIEAPDLVRRVRALPTEAFSTLVQQVGLEDAGEIVALATTAQIVAAFDEDLFVNESPGERESFDARRFVLWLEVLVEAGDTVAARRVAELSEDFVIYALSQVVLVLDHDALLLRMSDGGATARRADKAIESSLSEEIDGYLLISRIHDGWDAAIALILALDRDHRSLLERILDRSAAMASQYVDDLDALAMVLSSEESLAQDVEAEREDRRSRKGFVEPRAARSFLALARKPMKEKASLEQRDPVTAAYFRDFGEPSSATAPPSPGSTSPRTLDEPALTALPSGSGARSDRLATFVEAMALLSDGSPGRFSKTMAELAYLANVLVAGGSIEGGRLRPAKAAEAALATVALGAELEVWERREVSPCQRAPAAREELKQTLQSCPADLLFRKASTAVAASEDPVGALGFIPSGEELERVIAICRAQLETP